MLELSAPGLLFNRQKLFKLRDSVSPTTTQTGPHNVAVVYDLPGEVLPQPVKEMLDRLAQACQFKPEETIYINTRFNAGITLGQIQSQYKPVAVLIFGEVSISRNLSKLKRNFAYELSGTKVINTDSLDLLVKNDAAKKALWGELKKMLGL